MEVFKTFTTMDDTTINVHDLHVYFSSCYYYIIFITSRISFANYHKQSISFRHLFLEDL